MSASSPIPMTDDDRFEREIAAGGLVAVEFGGAWCPPCRLMEPVVTAVAQQLAGRVRFLQMDADANPRTSIRYGVRGLPTIIVFRDGSELDRIIGAVPLAVLLARIDRLTP